ncbi:subtilisin-like protease [Typha angustifolia]|uniref:subtilisin-like protease n=1 Tax=Typha angustifolia TaxID=59011 RepID=UPI003C2BEB91
MAPHAHWVSCRCCSVVSGFPPHAITKAVEKEIWDGIDVLNIFTNEMAQALYHSIVTITSFMAMEKGIITSAYTGNGKGTVQETVANKVPWILTIGVSHNNRRIRAIVKLTNGMEFYNESRSQITSGKASNSTGSVLLIKACHRLNGIDTGKIVICHRWGDRKGQNSESCQGGKGHRFFEMGAKQVNPSAPFVSGLVYDIQYDDYIRYLCGMGNYSSIKIIRITKRTINCLHFRKIIVEQLNCLSISVSLDSIQEKIIYRKVTNVGEAKSAYTVQVVKPDGVSVVVSPATLQFTKAKEQKSFSVNFTTGRAIPTLETTPEDFSIGIPTITSTR